MCLACASASSQHWCSCKARCRNEATSSWSSHSSPGHYFCACLPRVCTTLFSEFNHIDPEGHTQALAGVDSWWGNVNCLKTRRFYWMPKGLRQTVMWHACSVKKLLEWGRRFQKPVLKAHWIPMDRELVGCSASGKTCVAALSANQGGPATAGPSN